MKRTTKELLLESWLQERLQEPKRAPIGLDSLNVQPNGGVENIKKVYNEATPEEKDYWGKWYHYAQADVQELAATYNVPFLVMAACVAALSPGNKWASNLLAADRFFTGNPKIPAYPNAVAKARQILDAQNPALLTGPKVSVFYRSLVEPRALEHDMVLDGHAINIWRGEKRPLKGLGKPTAAERKQMIDDYHQAAQELGVPVQAVQATTWYIYKYTHVLHATS